ncbi:hypothetical protein ACTXT7_014428 [Hymenolepis weldensis]
MKLTANHIVDTEINLHRWNAVASFLPACLPSHLQCKCLNLLGSDLKEANTIQFGEVANLNKGCTLDAVIRPPEY